MKDLREAPDARDEGARQGEAKREGTKGISRVYTEPRLAAARATKSFSKEGPPIARAPDRASDSLVLMRSVN